MPIDAVQQVLRASGDAAVRDVLTRHRNRLADQARTMHRMIRVVDHYIAEGVTMPGLKTPRLVQTGGGTFATWMRADRARSGTGGSARPRRRRLARAAEPAAR